MKESMLIFFLVHFGSDGVITFGESIPYNEQNQDGYQTLSADYRVDRHEY